jgi:hypothetical protein
VTLPEGVGVSVAEGVPVALSPGDTSMLGEPEVPQAQRESAERTANNRAVKRTVGKKKSCFIKIPFISLCGPRVYLPFGGAFKE